MKILIFIIILLLALYTYEIVTNRKKKSKKEWDNYVSKFNTNRDLTTRHSVRDMPIPMVLINDGGDIIWQNLKFLKMCDNENISNENITEIIPNIDLLELESEEKQEFDVEYQGNFYNVPYSALDEKMTMLYFIDQTDYNVLLKKYKNQKVNIGFIYIDNYEELMDETDEANKFIVLGEVDKKLNTLSKDIESIIKKTDRNKYIMVFNNKNLDLLRKFQILDEIRDISLGNTIPVTLSMGIGIGHDSLRETYKNARAAMDIALGRGGDQAVLKDKDKVSFYGGSVQALEKRTKVKARVLSDALKQFIDEAENIFIMGHKVGDMDSFGASIGIYRIAKNRGKKCFIVLNSLNPSIKNIYEMMEREQPDYLEDIVTYNSIKNMSFKSSVCIVVDTHIPKQTEAPELLEKVEKVIVIDHHRRGESFIEEPALSYVET